MIKNFKSHAMPRLPRPQRPAQAVHDETTEQGEEDFEDNEQEEIVIGLEEDDMKPRKIKKKFFRSFFDSSFESKMNYDSDYVKSSKGMRNTNSCVNVQTTGTVYNIVNARDVRLGDDYYLGMVNSSPPKETGNHRQYEEDVKKDNFIALLMECTKKARYKLLLDWVCNDDDAYEYKCSVKLLKVI